MASETKLVRERKGRAAIPATRRPRPPLMFCHYVVAIEGWEWSLSFGLGDPKYDPEPFRDYRHLQLRGTLLRPSQLKVSAVELTLLPDARLSRNDWPERSPNSVGSLSLNTNRERLLQGLLTLPADALAQVLTVLTAGRFKYALLNGEPLRHRQALIRHYSLETMWEDDADELPPDP
jgi:hypothetical protein